MIKKILVPLSFIFILGYVIRTLFLQDLALTFGYDQARDAIVSQQILGGDLKVLGPPASQPGLYHGVFYYYVLAFGYLIGSGSPIIAAYWIALLNTFTVFIVFYLTYLLTKRLGAAILASLLFAVSFEASQYAVWLSNPTIGVWTVPITYLGLWIWINPSASLPRAESRGSGQGRKWGPVLAALGLGMSIQAEIFLLYHFVPVLLWLWIAGKNVSKREVISFGAVLLLSLFTMVFSEFKFGFRGLEGVSQLLINQDPFLGSRGMGDFILLYLNQLGKVFAFSTYPGNVGYGGAFVLGLIIYYLTRWGGKGLSWQPFLATWLFSHIAVVSVGGTSTPFLLVGIGPAVSILLGIFVYGLWQSENKIPAIIVFLILVFGNISMILRENPKGQTIFSIQKEMTLKRQLVAIDYTYQSANSHPFSIRTLTSPLDINIVWAYLYNWYGLPKYGYVPEWWGPDQIGQLITLPNVKPETLQHYFIVEPLGGIKPAFFEDAQSHENSRSNLVEEKEFAYIKVQKREVTR